MEDIPDCTSHRSPYPEAQVLNSQPTIIQRPRLSLESVVACICIYKLISMPGRKYQPAFALFDIVPTAARISAAQVHSGNSATSLPSPLFILLCPVALDLAGGRCWLIEHWSLRTQSDALVLIFSHWLDFSLI